MQTISEEDRDAPVLLNDFRRQWADVGPDVEAALRRVGESGWYILGKEVQAFEHDLGATTQHCHVVGCGNGMDAIEMGLRARGMTPGTRVLTTGLSAFATTLAIVRAGGIPVFVDVDDRGLIDLDATERALHGDPRLRFLVPVHLYGHALDLDRLGALAQRFGVEVVEDCCQAIGARWRGKAVGSVGAAAATSFYPTKNLGALGDGGAVLSNDASVDASCRALRDYGQTSRYRHSVLGLNSRLDELHAAMLRSALLPRLAGWTARRRAIAARYIAGIANPRVTPQPAPQGSESVWHLFPVLLPASQRDSFRAHLEAARIGSAVHYPEVLSRQGALSAVSFEVCGSLERAIEFCQREVSLPIHPYMTDGEVEQVISAVNDWQAP